MTTNGAEVKVHLLLSDLGFEEYGDGAHAAFALGPGITELSIDTSTELAPSYAVQRKANGKLSLWLFADAVRFEVSSDLEALIADANAALG